MTDDRGTVINPLRSPLNGSIRVPGDKSISHRAVLFSAMAEGTSRVNGVLDSDDVRSSIVAVTQLGARVNLEKQLDGSLAGGITGWGALGPQQPQEPIDCGNSGTTARLLMGVLAPWPIRVTLTGDESLSKRPMRRITAPLMKMGVDFEPAGKEHLPITEIGHTDLKAISYESPMASAQLKTAVLLAGLGARGKTTITEPSPSRNHTELMLPDYGAFTTANELTSSVAGPCTLHACEITVPGDPSSAAFPLCAAVMMPGSEVQIENVSLNTGRTGFLRVLERMGAEVDVKHIGHAGKEPFGIISACYSSTLHGCDVASNEIASMIDEIPVLALVAAHARGVTVFRDVKELRAKETDRVAATQEGLKLLGIENWMHGDDLFIEGDPALEIPEGLVFESHGDHRLAMTWALVGMCHNTPVTVNDFESVSVSFPGFLKTMEEVGR